MGLACDCLALFRMTVLLSGCFVFILVEKKILGRKRQPPGSKSSVWPLSPMRCYSRHLLALKSMLQYVTCSSSWYWWKRHYIACASNHCVSYIVHLNGMQKAITNITMWLWWLSKQLNLHITKFIILYRPYEHITILSQMLQSGMSFSSFNLKDNMVMTTSSKKVALSTKAGNYSVAIPQPWVLMLNCCSHCLPNLHLHPDMSKENIRRKPKPPLSKFLSMWIHIFALLHPEKIRPPCHDLCTIF